MRGLFRFALTLAAAGLGVLGCNRSDSPGTSGDPSAKEGPIDAPYQAAFRVPGMS